ncbi:MAG TPA: hypothetical protein GXX75_02765 [Clostridiales bacterium]|nr:hypothetical protein [Clostridiales bacterium]
MKKSFYKVVSMMLAVTLAFGLLTGCSSGKSGGPSKDAQFTWWIDNTDGAGTYYTDYSENMAVQYLNAQYWDTENHTLGTKENGKKLSLSFQVPITGSEADNFSTMIATGEYPDIMSLSYSSQSPQQLYQDGVLMDLTEYVEKYMPNYITVLNENPDLKQFTTVTDADGKDHYYALYAIADGVGEPWQGYMYRRDWVVKYAQPTEYIWDWNSDYVKQNGHPLYTPLAVAQEAGDYTGWTENPVTEFTFSQGDDPNNDWTDNVIFPSGKTEPYTISDWEWMMEGFSKALEEKGFAGDSNAYCLSLYYPGYMATGDLVSSFGGGGPAVYKNDQGKAAFGGTGSAFKTYLECMNNWYNKGWLDKKFETRSSDMFFQINPNGYNQGMVGIWCGGVGILGSSIRSTCTDAEDQKDAFVTGCSFPINDVYGDESNKYKEPDMMYQGGKIGATVGITTAAEGKDLEPLFSMLNYLQSYEGARIVAIGLDKEQYASMEFSPDYYASNGIDCAYTIENRGDGVDTYVQAVDASSELSPAIRGQRLLSRALCGNREKGYLFDRGYAKVTQSAIESWLAYTSTAQVLDYPSLMDDEQSALNSKVGAYIEDYMSMSVPALIKNGLSDWDNYCKKLNKYGPEKITEIYQELFDKYNINLNQ